MDLLALLVAEILLICMIVSACCYLLCIKPTPGSARCEPGPYVAEDDPWARPRTPLVIVQNPREGSFAIAQKPPARPS